MIELHGDFDGDWVFSVGKHDPQTFADAVNELNSTDYRADEVLHLFGRFVPSGHYSDNKSMWFDVEDGRSIRGAYVITCIYTERY